MSGVVRRDGAQPPRRAPVARAGRIAAAILLVLLVVLAIGIWRRDRPRAAAGPTVTVKVPRPPRAGNALSASAAAPSAARGTASASGGMAPTGATGEGVPARGASREPGSTGRDTAGGEPIDRTTGERAAAGGGLADLKAAAATPSRAIVAAPFRPVVLAEGELRLFLGGVVSVPVVIPEIDARIVVASTGDGGPAEIMIAAGPGGKAAVSVLSGTVAVAAGGCRVRLGPGSFTTVARGLPPAPPQPQPPSSRRGARSGGS